MASIKIQLHSIIKSSKNSLQFHVRTFSPSYVPTQHQFHHYPLYTFHSKPLHKSKIPPLSLYCSLSPPTSKEEAVLQAKTCLSTTLQKPLNNPKLTGKLKKLKQPRFQVEIPVVDDSPSSLSQLALDVFGEMPIRRKGSAVKILLIWPNPTLTKAAVETFESSKPSNSVEHMDISSVTNEEPRILGSADLAVFLVPETSQLAVVEIVTNSLYPRPVVVFNPKWDFEEEKNSFVESFEVVYSFMGLEVRGLLSKRQGVVFKCVRDGALSGERWSVLVMEEGKLRVVSRFNNRPSIVEVENVLYNLMAINSPITKSAKFLKNIVSNVTGKKE